VHEDYDPGFTWQWQGDDTTQVLWVGIKDFPTAPTGVREKPLRNSLKVSLLENPVKNLFRLFLTLNCESRVSLRIYDASGRQKSEIFRGRLEKGTHEILWDLKDSHGKRVPPGVYFYRLEAEGQSLRGKFLLIR
jgi:hypothetical protein